ncbi:MAG: hypothetical protein HYW25_03905 [Candidatus Aenigmarchaeota archaeon]|nr:hypothetical protein [Candidatus Aenigmarchaeota archaeon]
MTNVLGLSSSKAGRERLRENAYKEISERLRESSDATGGLSSEVLLEYRNELASAYNLRSPRRLRFTLERMINHFENILAMPPEERHLEKDEREAYERLLETSRAYLSRIKEMED